MYKEFFNRKCKFNLLVFVFLAFSTPGGGSYNQVVYIWRKGDVEMMDFKKGLLALSLFGVFSGG